MRILASFVCLGVLTLSAHAKPELRSGQVFLPDSKPPVLLYRYQYRSEQTPSGKAIDTSFQQPDGTPVVAESLRYQSDRLQSYRVDRKREGVVDSLAIVGNQVQFVTTVVATGEKKTDSDDWDASHIVIPELLDYVLANWDTAMKGDSVSFRLAIVEKRDTYGFSLSKDQVKTVGGRKVVSFKVAPTSFFVSLALSPIYLDFDLDRRKLLAMRNLSLPHPDSGPNEIRDIEADVIYLEK